MKPNRSVEVSEYFGGNNVSIFKAEASTGVRLPLAFGSILLSGTTGYRQ
jgi:hypothetical protein